MSGTEIGYPLLFKPVYKDYIWGGDRIARTYRPDLPAGVRAESWEISDRPEGMSTVTNGPLAGMSLRELVSRFGTGLLGRGRELRSFPLLVKIIDARETLSVQVHPDDQSARVTGGEAKTEAWCVLGGGAGARMLAGLKPGTDRGAFEMALRDGSVERRLVAVPAVEGEAVFIPGGRVHAIGAGCLLLEVQQNSNTTYRVYDWGRTGADGKPRELHVAQALKVINWSDGAQARFIPRRTEQSGGNSTWSVLECGHFRIERLEPAGPMEVENDGSSFHAIFVEQGPVRIEAGGVSVNAPAGVSSLLAASVKRYSLVPASGSAACRVLRIRLP